MQYKNDTETSEIVFGSPNKPVNNIIDAKAIMGQILRNQYAKIYEENPVLYFTLGYTKESFIDEMVKPHPDPNIKEIIHKIMDNNEKRWAEMYYDDVAGSFCVV